jgi:hypothetical protein
VVEVESEGVVLQLQSTARGVLPSGCGVIGGWIQAVPGARYRESVRRMGAAETSSSITVSERGVGAGGRGHHYG